MTESNSIPEAGEPVSAGLTSGKLPPQLREVMFLAAAAAEAGESVSAGLASGMLSPQLRELVAKSASAKATELQPASENPRFRGVDDSRVVVLAQEGDQEALAEISRRMVQ
jgi:hypothetical protein